MTTETISIQVPQALYHRLERLAELTHRPLESLVVQTLTSTIPPLPDDLPAPARDALVALEKLTDDELWRITQATMPEAEFDRFTALRERRRAGTIMAAEQGALDQLSQEADLLALRKAYAAVLLKWRGHRLPTLVELEAQL